MQHESAEQCIMDECACELWQQLSLAIVSNCILVQQLPALQVAQQLNVMDWSCGIVSNNCGDCSCLA